MDMFDELKPDIVFISGENFSNRSIEFVKRIYPKTILVCVGEISDCIVEPNLCINDFHHSNLATIVFSDGPMLGRIGRPSVDDYLKSDIVCITNNIEKIEGLDKQIIEYVSSMSDVVFKAFGTKKIPVKNYLGIVDSQTEANAINSSKIVLDLDGGSGYDGLWLKKNVITTKDTDFSKRVTNVLECKQAIDEVIDSEERADLKIYVQTRTYFDLLCNVFRFIGLEEPANYMMQKKGELI
tara:strand:- start:61 stop:777 length:717 start_codon:yes stop_codon:yes gene_type:complete